MAGTKRKAPRNKRAFLFGRCHDKATARKFGGSSADPLPVMVMPDSMAIMVIAIVMVIGECRGCGGECRDSDYDGHGDLFHSFALGKDEIRYEQAPCPPVTESVRLHRFDTLLISSSRTHRWAFPFAAFPVKV
jgi:hypothetical protein